MIRVRCIIVGLVLTYMIALGTSVGVALLIRSGLMDRIWNHASLGLPYAQFAVTRGTQADAVAKFRYCVGASLQIVRVVIAQDGVGVSNAECIIGHTDIALYGRERESVPSWVVLPPRIPGAQFIQTSAFGWPYRCLVDYRWSLTGRHWTFAYVKMYEQAGVEMASEWRRRMPIINEDTGALEADGRFFRLYWRGLLSNVIAMGSPIALLVIVVIQSVPVIRVLQGRCARCGYSTRGLKDRCPECGRSLAQRWF